MNRVPTLILGLGGIGCKIASQINRMLTDEDRAYVGVVGLDTNVSDLSGLRKEDENIVLIRTSDDRRVGQFLKENPEYQKWFPLNAFLADRDMVHGAGQIRAISRLAALAAEKRGEFAPIRQTIDRIRERKGDEFNGNLTVMIVGSITGGTGAGLFLQMPYYLRELMRNDVGLSQLIIRGMFVGPDLTAAVQDSDINSKAVRVNAYACLKELNAFYMTQIPSDTDTPLELDHFHAKSLEEISGEARSIAHDSARLLDDLGLYGDEEFLSEQVLDDARDLAGRTNEIPYDYLYLVENSAAGGTAGTPPLEALIGQVARIVHTLMFTPVAGNALSIEDNFVLHNMQYGGMNRYAGAGICRLVYPHALAEEYTTLATVRDLVTEEWLLLDQEFAEERREALSRQETDGSVEIPKLPETYVRLFEAEISPGGKLARLYPEAFTKNEERVETALADVFIEQMEEQVKRIEESDAVRSAEEKCEVNRPQMKGIDSARKEINRVCSELIEYEIFAKDLARSSGLGIANQIFPSSRETMRAKKTSEANIFQFLARVHPITARYLCYSITQKLEEMLEFWTQQVAQTDFEEFADYDYDKKHDGKQDARAALETLHGSSIPVIGKRMGKKNALQQLTNEFCSQADTQRELISGYLSSYIKRDVARVLIERFKQLSEQYELFFDSLQEKLKDNAVRINDLERSGNTRPFGQVIIYGSGKALRQIYRRFRVHRMGEVSDDMKERIFLKLFGMFVDEEEKKRKENDLTKPQQEKGMRKRKELLKKVFDDSVVETIQESVRKFGTGVVHITVREALALEMELESDSGTVFADEDEREEAVREYIKKRIAVTLRMAEPMLAAQRSDPAAETESVYLALHPDCADMRLGEPSTEATETALLDKVSADTNNHQVKVLLDEAFSPYEIICYRAQYNFLIEDLVKYRDDSENERAYRERIVEMHQLRSSAYEGHPDGFKVTANPHLNRYWQEEGFLPAISGKTRARDHEDVMKAFVYAVGFDNFHRRKNPEFGDRTLWYYDTFRGSVPVKQCGSFVQPSYASLYKAIPFNGVIKRRILAYARKRRQEMKGYEEPSQLAAGIMDNLFIMDLIQAEPLKDAEDGNLFDILLSMRGEMRPEQWTELFNGVLLTLWEFLGDLFNRNQLLVNQKTRTILIQIYRFSRPGKKETEKSGALTFEEGLLKEQVKILLGKTYIG